MNPMLYNFLFSCGLLVASLVYIIYLRKQVFELLEMNDFLVKKSVKGYLSVLHGGDHVD